MEALLENHSGELMILILTALVLLALLILVPQLLRSHHQIQQLRHEEALKALEHGHLMPAIDDRSRFAGRTASLVPMVTIISAGTVTCFLAGYKAESLFAVALSVWSVAGVVSLAAITGGVSLMARLAQLSSGEQEVEPAPEEQPVEH